EVLAVCLIVAFFFLLRWPFRDVTLIRDEGEYAYIGQLILRGGVPYRDAYNQKTPFVFFFFAAIQSILGDGIPALRVATTVYGLATTAVLYAAARLLFGWYAAAGTALAFTVMT